MILMFSATRLQTPCVLRRCVRIGRLLRVERLLRGRYAALAMVGMGAIVAGCVAVVTSLQPLPESLPPPSPLSKKRQVVDRSGHPLSYTFSTGFNLSDERPLHRIPQLLRDAFIEAEDRRFYHHSGADWWARLHAVWQNCKALRVVRGASTISEQVVRMLHPRPRSLWARALEGIEASILESRFSKQEILEFYLNQVPFAAGRRGVAQAARYFWDRDLETLNEREQLALAVMVRAPERLDLYKDPSRVDRGLARLADRLRYTGSITEEQHGLIDSQTFALSQGALPVRADHFVRHLQGSVPDTPSGKIWSTIDSHVQRTTQKILDSRISDLSAKGVSDGAVLVVDNRTAEVLAWVNAGEFGSTEGSQIDAITIPRQPGSTLKPLLYALALSRGWTAATVLNDAPLSEAVGAGLHTYRNYSRFHYGDISLREALGNSLNIPAIKTIHHLGTQEFLHFLERGGFTSLHKPADFYGEGLALGNGEVTLFELVQAYSALAHRGVWRPLRIVRNSENASEHAQYRTLISPEVSSLVGDILSDPQARRREFGSDGLLRLPVQTAIKTGTSTDYRDAWAIGYSEAFTVGVWMGNLNRSSMNEISGARGPTLVLRSVFAELQRGHETRPLYRAPSLLHRSVCPLSGELASERCPHVEEIFVSGTEPTSSCSKRHDATDSGIDRPQTNELVRIVMPTPGLNVARDPRIPDHLEALPLEVDTPLEVTHIEWIVDDHKVGTSIGQSRRHLWPLVSGHHTVRARVTRTSGAPP